MADVSTKPYLIRAIHEWCSDSGLTPYIAVLADAGVNVPHEFVKNGEIVLNISPLATNRLKLGNESIEFQARFGGVAREVTVPVDKVIAVYARENGQGMAFDVPRNVQASWTRRAPTTMGQKHCRDQRRWHWCRCGRRSPPPTTMSRATLHHRLGAAIDPS